MKRIIITTLFVISLFYSTSIHAQDEIQTKYFGVGATVEEIDQAVFSVKTNGEKAGEGFVFTSEQIKSGEKLNLKADLTGDETVRIKVVETDANGKFVAEHHSPAILLETSWKEFGFQANINKKTKQIDVFVLTDSPKKFEFKFRDAVIK